MISTNVINVQIVILFTSGLYVHFMYFAKGKENVTCVAMRADQPIGLWENQDCSSKHSFICQFPRHGGFSTTPTTPTPYPNVPCPPGWMAYWDKCIFVSVLFISTRRYH